MITNTRIAESGDSEVCDCMLQCRPIYGRGDK